MAAATHVAPGPTDEVVGIGCAAELGLLMSSGYSTLLTLPAGSVSVLAESSVCHSPSTTYCAMSAFAQAFHGERAQDQELR